MLAGRAHERLELGQRLECIRRGQPGGGVVLYGPRGNGKTTLLSELEAMARKKRKTTVRKLRPVLSEGNGPCTRWEFADEEVSPEETKTVRGYGIARFVWRGRETKSVPAEEGVQNLFAMAKAGPLLLLVDEAHELPSDFGRVLLNEAQLCVSSRFPLFAVFAGTPGLPSRFQQMSASFWERSKRLLIGRLESDAMVRDALSVPAKQSGFPMDADALELLVQESQRYPYFIQMNGAAAWAAAQAGKHRNGRISVADARAGLEAAGMERDLFYESRREELLRHGVLDEAEAVSKEMVTLGDNEPLAWQRLAGTLDSVAVGGSGNTRESAREMLVHLGLIWATRPANWEPGIPPLCAYLVKHVGRR